MKRKTENLDCFKSITTAAKKTLSLTGTYTRNATCVALMIISFAINSTVAVCRYSLPGDLNNDCKVNLLDLSIMADNWIIDCNQLPLDPACVDASSLAQKFQFHSIEVALEIFGSDFGSYPPSVDNENISFAEVLGSDPNTYLGANKMAEAIVGMDLLGFHPNSTFRSDGQNYRNDGVGGFQAYQVYHADANDPGNTTGQYAETAEENIAARVGPYIDFEQARVFRLGEIYEDVISFNGSTLVLCDVFEKERSSGKKTGMPILYFRARSNFLEQDVSDGIENDIYYYPDNLALLKLGSAEDQLIQHPLSDGVDDWLDFENMILNPIITVIKRPYNSDSFILISAGHDGLYGTSDDIFNF